MKWIKRMAIGLLLLVGIGVAALAFFIDDAAESAIEEGGSYALGVPTQLTAANVGLFSGEFGLEGLEIDNPEGFNEPHFFTLGTARLEFPLSALASDELTVAQILIDGVTLDIERNSQGTNFDVLLDNLKRFESGSPTESESETEPQGGGKRILFKEIVIKNVKATVNLFAGAGDRTRIPITLPEVVLRDQSADGNGQTIEELFSTLMKGLLTSVMQSGQGILPADLLGDLQGRLGDLDQVLVDVQGEVMSEVEDKLDEVTTGLQDRAKGLEDEAGKALEGVSKELGGLLNKKP